jgi:hypothetical protein
MEQLFEQATREKLRFKLTNGVIGTEDLWDLKLEDLDKLARALNKQVKESGEESFIAVKTKANKSLELAFDIVKHVITVKLAEAEARKLRSEKAAKRAVIQQLIEKKEVQSLEGKSVEELMKDLALLD